MQVNIGKIITDIKGDTIKEGFTIGEAIINILLSSYEDEAKISGVEKMQRHKLSEFIHASKSRADLSLDDVVLIKKYLDKAGASPILYASVYNALETTGDVPVDGNESRPS